MTHHAIHLLWLMTQAASSRRASKGRRSSGHPCTHAAIHEPTQHAVDLRCAPVSLEMVTNNEKKNRCAFNLADLGEARVEHRTNSSDSMTTKSGQSLPGPPAIDLMSAEGETFCLVMFYNYKQLPWAPHISCPSFRTHGRPEANSRTRASQVDTYLW